MKHKTMVRVLRVLWLWQLLDRGVGMRLGAVVDMTATPRMTAYRYLRKLVACGLVNETVADFRNQTATFYSLSDDGANWMNGYDDIPF